MASISPDVADWFRAWRESYSWPWRTGRSDSENMINSLKDAASVAVAEQRVDKLHSALVAIHRWKTHNRQNQTSKYCASLRGLGPEYVGSLLGLAPFRGDAGLAVVIRKLKIPNCNLPICTAIASFLYDRKTAPVLDKFLSQFFAWEFKRDDLDQQGRAVLGYVRRLNFLFQDGGGGKLRLAVYDPRGYERNLATYVQEFVPECARIATDLSDAGVRFADVRGNLADFHPVDVEMAIFSWAQVHSTWF